MNERVKIFLWLKVKEICFFVFVAVAFAIPAIFPIVWIRVNGWSFSKHWWWNLLLLYGGLVLVIVFVLVTYQWVSYNWKEAGERMEKRKYEYEKRNLSL